mmetsp:Transcript_13258/g.17343  ORF Transcript_13258/g.17343 Transcript_13258/m.17343 type:complete len:238 (+) Transcript_13258:36-749(+)|eukprot:CAMPEP_0198147898 /NCGR_PEP_ID=MMETSP1443-20131203/38408_1 /TAXON_ID=186043 /ORGANISM="Entomoneis sp., Strain CCMP2396" /LENGTH=237 /DNA_ID=CAMNT_0043812417 /DNA_START=26 /DNA_END=739 /DNA_ORIENTATION=-
MVGFLFPLVALLSLPSISKKNDIESAESTRLLRESVVVDRQKKVLGVWVGSSLLVVGGGVGLAAGIFEPYQVATPVAAVALGVATWAKSLEEKNKPLPESHFTVGESRIPEAGKGLFAAKPIEMGTFLFFYTGERLTDDDYFERYPDGQGRYVAELPSPPWSLEEPIYVDGANSDLSGLARWMNSRSNDDSGRNVVGKKSITGTRNFHFYALCDIAEGEELCFDYGVNYWDAVAVVD